MSLISSGLNPARCEEGAHRAALLVDRGLDRRQLVPSSEKDTVQVARSAVTSRSETPRTRDRPLGHLGAAQAVAEHIAAGRQAQREDRHRAEQDGAAALQMLDMALDPAFVVEQTATGHDCRSRPSTNRAIIAMN